ncbi:hypothetical protein [Cupriavidus sp. DL-D2]|uniref:hypothetical protein n=1 Tax=Cupriavidus sp. DL-D2 TaxID=3144974 RepID=UPI0032124771
MTKRRRPEPGKTVDGADRIRRRAAIGEELDRLLQAAVESFTKAGAHGLTRPELDRGIDIGLCGSMAVVKRLRDEGRLYVADWRNGQPAYALGTLPDMPRPITKYAMGCRSRSRAELDKDVAELARAEIMNAHAKWAANWTPRRDPAAAWIGGPV